MLVLAVDVGIQVCGYVVCQVNGLDVTLVKEGEAKPPKKETLPSRINHIFEHLEEQVQQFEPEAIIVETLYSHYRHPTTLGVLAQVRGVVALLSHQKGLPFYEYPPTRARKSFVGRGNVTSAQVKKFAENITGKKFKSVHTADAYSLAVAFSHTQKYKKLNIVKK